MILLIFNVMMIAGGLGSVAKMSGSSQKMIEYMRYESKIVVESGKAIEDE